MKRSILILSLAAVIFAGSGCRKEPDYSTNFTVQIAQGAERADSIIWLSVPARDAQGAYLDLRLGCISAVGASGTRYSTCCGVKTYILLSIFPLK